MPALFLFWLECMVESGRIMKTLLNILVPIVLALAFADCYGATPPSSLSIKVTVYLPVPTVTINLDGKYSCQIKSNRSCIFSADCAKFTGQDCVAASIGPGKHVIEVAGFDMTTSLDLPTPESPETTSDTLTECWISESNGSARLHFECK